MKSALSSATLENTLRHITAGHDAATAAYVAAVAFFNWHGVWEPDRVYEEHALVDYEGETWVSRIPTQDEPGTGNAWVLARTHIRVASLDLPAPPNMPPPPGPRRKARRSSKRTVRA